MVAAPAFPLSRKNAPGGTTAADLANQPGDVRFVISETLRLSRDRRSRLHGLVDPKRVRVAGKSLGAITVFEIGYNPAERDPRIKAVIAMTGIVGGAGEHFRGIDTPLLLEHGDVDTTVPIEGSRDAFAQAQPPKFFVTLFGQTHGSAFGGGTKPAEQVVERTTLDFLDRYRKGQKAALRPSPPRRRFAGRIARVEGLVERIGSRRSHGGRGKSRGATGGAGSGGCGGGCRG